MRIIIIHLFIIGTANYITCCGNMLGTNDSILNYMQPLYLCCMTCGILSQYFLLNYLRFTAAYRVRYRRRPEIRYMQLRALQ